MTLARSQASQAYNSERGKEMVPEQGISPIDAMGGG